MRILLFLIVFVVTVSCRKSPNRPGNTENATHKLFIDSSDTYVIKAKYPLLNQDNGNEIKELIDMIISQEKENWKEEPQQKTNSGKKEKPGLFIDYESFESQNPKTKSYLIKSVSKYGTSETANVYTLVFLNNKKVDIEAFLNLEDDLQLTKFLKEQALKQDKNLNPKLLDKGLGLSYLKPGTDILNDEVDGYFYGSNFWNFTVDDSGLDFYFASGDIAPEADGIQKIRLSWEQLKPYLISGFNMEN